jgi:hypothetical protein
MPLRARRRSRRPVALVQSLLGIAVLVLVAGAPGIASGQTSEDCLMCHSDREATGEKGGQPISVFVDPQGYSKSVHGELACIDCHSDLEGVELPHAEDLQPVVCAICHDDVAAELASGPHGRLPADPRSPSAMCVRCHGTHAMLPARGPASATTPARVTAQCAG